MEEFKIGEWYEIGNPWSKYQNLVKVSQIHSDTKITASEYYNIKCSDGHSEGYTKYKGTYSEISHARKITLEELRKYIPNHEDLKILETYEIY